MICEVPAAANGKMTRQSSATGNLKTVHVFRVKHVCLSSQVCMSFMSNVHVFRLKDACLACQMCMSFVFTCGQQASGGRHPTTEFTHVNAAETPVPVPDSAAAALPAAGMTDSGSRQSLLPAARFTVRSVSLSVEYKHAAQKVCHSSTGSPIGPGSGARGILLSFHSVSDAARAPSLQHFP